MGHQPASGPGKHPEGQWLGGPHPDGPESNLSAAGQQVLDDIVVASGHAGGCQQKVRIKTLLQLGVHGFQIIASNSQKEGHSSIAKDGRRHAVAIAVVDLAGRNWTSGLQKLVARSNDRHHGPANDFHHIPADGGQHTDLGGTQEHTFLEHGLTLANVLSGGAHVGPFRRAYVDLDFGNIR